MVMTTFLLGGICIILTKRLLRDLLSRLGCRCREVARVRGVCREAVEYRPTLGRFLAGLQSTERRFYSGGLAKKRA